MANPNILACKILAIDDHPIQLKIFSRILENYGFTNVTLLADSQQAMTAFGQGVFDLVLIDLDMPGISGHQLLEYFRQQSGNEFIPLLVVTASRGKEDLVRCFSLGAHDFISRPVHRDELVYRIVHLLSVRVAYRALPAALKSPNGRVALAAVYQGRILVVEDHLQQLKIVQRVLQSGGFTQVEGISDPGMPLRQAFSEDSAPYDLVILDLHLPGVEITTVIQQIQGHDIQQAPFILAMTADDDNAIRSTVFAAGVQNFIAKPIERDILLAKVVSLVGLRLLV